MNDLLRIALDRRSILKASLLSFIPIASAEAASLSLSTKVTTPIGSNSARIQIITNQSVNVYIEYGFTRARYTFKSSVLAAKPGSNNFLALTNLKAQTKVYYRLRYSLKTSANYLAKTEQNFLTSAVTSNSTFAVQADPHMDNNSSAEVYTKTLEQIAAISPAFLMDLGDIFMVDKLPDKSEANIRARFELMQGFYKKIGNVPLKICLGNHDGELGYSKFNTKNYRKEYFPEQTGELAYYSFEGPDQLHVVLDPFTYTTSSPKDDGWQWTLGKVQYDWLSSTLANSKATHKFIYIHHLLVGNATSRGGVEVAMRNEWGGKNNDGSYGFEQNRPGWGKPVHQLLLENNVGFVFKGHDHLYVKQELDGIIYQTLPQPSHPGEKIDVKQYGYLSGKGVGGSGFLRVRTDAKIAFVDFIKFDGSIGDSYTKVMN